MEDPAAAAEGAAPATKPARERKNGKQRNYADAALAANQAPVTSLMPSRPWTLWVFVLSGLTVIALLNLLNAELPRLSGWLGAEHVDPLNFAVRGNLAAALSALLLAWSAVLSAQIYNLRRHRVDDYKGRYRLWIGVVVLLACAALDAATGLHDAAGGLLIRLAGKEQTWSATSGWLILASVVVLPVALRIGIDMRRSIGTLVALGVALVCYATGAAVRIGWLPLEAELGWHAMVTATLLGHLFVWCTTLVFARHVYLDAQGLLAKRKEAKPKKKKEEPAKEKPADEAAGEKSAKQVRIDAAHGDAAKTPTPASSSGGLKGLVAAATSKSASTPSGNEQQKLSKAERKKLRRQGRDDDDDDE
jgi:hypothetical protein